MEDINQTLSKTVRSDRFSLLEAAVEDRVTFKQYKQLEQKMRTYTTSDEHMAFQEKT